MEIFDGIKIKKQKNTDKKPLTLEEKDTYNHVILKKEDAQKAVEQALNA